MMKFEKPIVKNGNKDVDGFIEKKPSSEEISVWLAQRILLAREEDQVKLSEKQWRVRKELVRQSNANVELEGLKLSDQANMLNELYIRGYIDIEQKLALIKKFYGK